MKKNYYETPCAHVSVFSPEYGFAASSDFDLTQGENDNEFA